MRSVVIIAVLLAGCAHPELRPKPEQIKPRKVARLPADAYRVKFDDETGRVAEIRTLRGNRLIMLNDKACPGPTEDMVRAAQIGDEDAKGVALREAIHTLHWCAD